MNGVTIYEKSLENMPIEAMMDKLKPQLPEADAPEVCLNAKGEPVPWPKPLDPETIAKLVRSAMDQYAEARYTINREESFRSVVTYTVKFRHYARLWRVVEGIRYIGQEHKRAMERACLGLLPPCGPRIVGGTGTGKTTLLRFINDRLKWAFYDVHEVRRGLLIHGGEYLNDWIARTGNVPVMIDDVGAERGATFFGSSFGLDDLIVERYKSWVLRGIPTIISTNLTNGMIADRYGKRISGRIAEMTFPALWGGIDHRTGKKST